MARRVLAVLVIVGSLGPARSAAPVTPSTERNGPIYCVREAPPAELDGCDFVVDRIEDVPLGATLVPSHGGLDDPEEIRRFWCLHPFVVDDPPPPGEVEPKCLRFLAAEYGGEYATLLAAQQRQVATSAAQSEVPVESIAPSLNLPAVHIGITPDVTTLRMPAMSLTLRGGSPQA